MFNRKARRAYKAKGLRMPRSEEEIKTEYGQLCAKAGELQYSATQIDLQLKEINKKLMNLNREFHSLKKPETAKEQAQPVPAEPSAVVEQSSVQA